MYYYIGMESDMEQKELCAEFGCNNVLALKGRQAIVIATPYGWHFQTSTECTTYTNNEIDEVLREGWELNRRVFPIR